MNLSTDPASADASDVVELVVPRGHRYIATARVVAASIGADLGLNVDQIDDLRLAVDEAVAVVVDAAPDTARVGIQFAAGADLLSVRVTSLGDAPLPITRADIDPLALRIIEAVADSFEVVDGVLVMAKRTTAGNGD